MFYNQSLRGSALGNELLSVVGVLIGVFAFGTYMVPLKKYHDFSSWSFLVAMSIGAALCSVGIAVVKDCVTLNVVGLACGALWVVGGALCFWAVQAERDLAGTGLRSMCVSILLSFIIGVTIFREPSLLYFSIPAIACMLGGILLQAPKGQHVLRNWRSLSSGAIFGTYLIPMKLSGIRDDDFLLPFAVGICITSIVLVLILNLKRKKTLEFKTVPVLFSLGAGVLWMFGTLAIFWAVAEDGLFGYAIGYPLLQLNLVVNQMWGILAFGEYATRHERVKLALSTVVILLGAVLLTISKG